MKTIRYTLKIVVILLCCACKNEKKSINSYEINISTDGNTSTYRITSNAVLVSLKDSTYYGLLFSDGPNKSVIAKLHRLEYTVNETAKLLTVTNNVVDTDTIQTSSSKKLTGSNRQSFDINLTNVIALNDYHGRPDCDIINVCCFTDEYGNATCCSYCEEYPNNCKECMLMEPDIFSGVTSNLIYESPDDVPSLNKIFKNHTTLNIKLK